MKPKFIGPTEKKQLDSKLGKIVVMEKYIGAMFIEYGTGEVFVFTAKGWEKLKNNQVNLTIWEKMVKKDLKALTVKKNTDRVKNITTKPKKAK